MDDYVLPEDIIEKIKKGYSEFDKLSEKQIEIIIDNLLSHIKQVGPELIKVLDRTSDSIKKNPAKAMEGLEIEITKRMMELLIYFKILKDSTGDTTALKIYLKTITNLIPFFMSKLGILCQEDVSIGPLIFALSDENWLGVGGSTENS